MFVIRNSPDASATQMIAPVRAIGEDSRLLSSRHSTASDTARQMQSDGLPLQTAEDDGNRPSDRENKENSLTFCLPPPPSSIKAMADAPMPTAAPRHAPTAT